MQETRVPITIDLVVDDTLIENFIDDIIEGLNEWDQGLDPFVFDAMKRPDKLQIIKELCRYVVKYLNEED